MKKYKIAQKIEAIFKKMSKEYGFGSYTHLHSTRIYFNNQAWAYRDGIRYIIKDIRASDYTEYANNDTITCTFEGPVYDALNYGDPGWKLREELNDMLEKCGYYFEMGNAWNFSLYDTGLI